VVDDKVWEEGEGKRRETLRSASVWHMPSLYDTGLEPATLLSAASPEQGYDPHSSSLPTLEPLSDEEYHTTCPCSPEGAHDDKSGTIDSASTVCAGWIAQTLTVKRRHPAMGSARVTGRIHALERLWPYAGGGMRALRCNKRRRFGRLRKRRKRRKEKGGCRSANLRYTTLASFINNTR